MRSCSKKTSQRFVEFVIVVSKSLEKPLSNTQRAAVDLRDLIFAGELSPGSNHLESELAERLGMSRTPVREAALLLEGQGLLEVKPRKGVRILSISPSDFLEISEVLIELESLAAFRTARARLTEADLAALRQSVDEMEAALVLEDRSRWSEAADCFRQELVRLAGNKRVVDIFERLNDQVRRARAIILYLRRLPVHASKDLRLVYNAIQVGRPELAQDIYRRHCQQDCHAVVNILNQLNLTQL